MWLKALATIYKTNLRRLKGKENKADGLSISRLKEQHSVELPEGFFFFLIYLIHGAEETYNWEMPIWTDKMSTKKSLISLTKRPRKEQPSKTEKFWTITTLL